MPRPPVKRGCWLGALRRVTRRIRDLLADHLLQSRRHQSRADQYGGRWQQRHQWIHAGTNDARDAESGLRRAVPSDRIRVPGLRCRQRSSVAFSACSTSSRRPEGPEGVVELEVVTAERALNRGVVSDALADVAGEFIACQNGLVNDPGADTDTVFVLRGLQAGTATLTTYHHEEGGPGGHVQHSGQRCD